MVIHLPVDPAEQRLRLVEKHRNDLEDRGQCYGMAYDMLTQEELEGWEKCNYTMCSDELLNRPPGVCWSLDKGTDNILLRDGRRQTCFSSAASV